MKVQIDSAELRRRAAAHLKSGMRYERKGRMKKASAHFGRAMYYGAGVDFEQLSDHLCVWRTDQLSSMEGMCAGITGPGFEDAPAWKDTEWDVRLWDTRRVISMEGAFKKNGGRMSGVEAWNVGNVTNMRQMFRSARAFNRAIGMWDTSHVTNMSSMFEGASEFNQNIGMWDTSKVTNMSSMFEHAGFNRDIGKWDTGNVTDMSSMFDLARDFNQDLTKWTLRPGVLMRRRRWTQRASQVRKARRASETDVSNSAY